MITYKVNVNENGNISWYNEEEQLHCEHGPAIEYANGDKAWYLNGKRHREGGPAAEYLDGTKFWYRNGQRHREDGPAIEFADGEKWWYLNGVQMTEEYHARATSPVKELSVGEIEKLLGYRVKVIKE